MHRYTRCVCIYEFKTKQTTFELQSSYNVHLSNIEYFGTHHGSVTRAENSKLNESRMKTEVYRVFLISYFYRVYPVRMFNSFRHKTHKCIYIYFL